MGSENRRARLAWVGPKRKATSLSCGHIHLPYATVHAGGHDRGSEPQVGCEASQGSGRAAPRCGDQVWALGCHRGRGWPNLSRSGSGLGRVATGSDPTVAGGAGLRGDCSTASMSPAAAREASMRASPAAAARIVPTAIAPTARLCLVIYVGGQDVHGLSRISFLSRPSGVVACFTRPSERSSDSDEIRAQESGAKEPRRPTCGRIPIAPR